MITVEKSARNDRGDALDYSRHKVGKPLSSVSDQAVTGIGLMQALCANDPLSVAESFEQH